MDLIPTDVHLFTSCHQLRSSVTEEAIYAEGFIAAARQQYSSQPRAHNQLVDNIHSTSHQNFIILLSIYLSPNHYYQSSSTIRYHW